MGIFTQQFIGTAGIGFNKVNRTKSLERELAVVIESERTRIGRELHDDLGQRLTGISVSAEILATKLLAIDPALAMHANQGDRMLIAQEQQAMEVLIVEDHPVCCPGRICDATRPDRTWIDHP